MQRTTIVAILLLLLIALGSLGIYGWVESGSAFVCAPTVDQSKVDEYAKTIAAMDQVVDLEPIRKLLESDESDMIPCQALDSVESARCGNLSTGVPRIELGFVTRVI
jgi:hypothetical protein